MKVRYGRIAAARTALGILAAVVTAGAPVGAGDVGEGGLDRLRGLAGEWVGKNSKGHEVRLTYETVADGSAVMERLDIRGGEHDHDMVTLFHLDGGRLMLTHYCAAGNQPRMRAAEASDREIRFEFLDATALKSPDDGHMHRAAFRFDGDDRLVASWTWRERGEDVFTEVIEVERVVARGAE